MLNRRQFVATALAGGAALSTNTSWAQDADLVEKARAEGQLVYYTNKANELARALADGFSAKYGIQVQIFRAGGAQLAQKLSLELRSRRVEADMFEANDPSLATLFHRQGAILPYQIQNAAGIAKDLYHPEFVWTASALSFGHLVANSSVPEADRPRTFTDLLDPKWQGKVVWASPNFGASQLVVIKGVVEMHGWEFVEKLAKQGTLVVRGFPDAENAVASGERPVGIDVSSRAGVAVRNGVPIEIIYPEEGSVVYLTALSILQGAKHPNAAKLFLEYCLSPEGQNIYSQEANYPVVSGIDAPEGLAPLNELKLHHINWEELLDQRDEVVKRWTSLMER